MSKAVPHIALHAALAYSRRRGRAAPATSQNLVPTYERQRMTEKQIPPTADIGLAGVVAFTSKISAIVGSTLAYSGYTIEDLAANSTFEETAYLLWHGELPNKNQLAQWRQDLAANLELPESLLDHLRMLKKTATPMSAMRTAVSILGVMDSETEDHSEAAQRRQCLRLTAQMGLLATAWQRLCEGKEVLPADPSKTLAENFFLTLHGKPADPLVVKMFDCALVLHADHTMNASTFAARVTTATGSDIYSAITSALGALKGPLHGGANEQVMRTLEKIKRPDNVESWLEQALERKEKIMGFGHRIYKNGDPRAKILSAMSKELGQKVGKPELYEMSIRIHDIMENKKHLYPNVDFYSASLYHCMNIPTALFTPVFAMSRIAGWLAHVIEQRRANKLIRPESIYVGPEERKWLPVLSR